MEELRRNACILTAHLPEPQELGENYSSRNALLQASAGSPASYYTVICDWGPRLPGQEPLHQAPDSSRGEVLGAWPRERSEQKGALRPQMQKPCVVSWMSSSWGRWDPGPLPQESCRGDTPDLPPFL